MSTTTIRLSEELKARVVQAAERAGTTPHNFILQAIAEKTEMDELSAQFHDVAEERYAEIVSTGKAIPWSEMKEYLVGRVAGARVKRPVAKKMR
jgi:predicted transcriptional regulator